MEKHPLEEDQETHGYLCLLGNGEGVAIPTLIQQVSFRLRDKSIRKVEVDVFDDNAVRELKEYSIFLFTEYCYRVHCLEIDLKNLGIGYFPKKVRYTGIVQWKDSTLHFLIAGKPNNPTGPAKIGINWTTFSYTVGGVNLSAEEWEYFHHILNSTALPHTEQNLKAWATLAKVKV